jgi:putative DNA primase/helicase
MAIISALLGKDNVAAVQPSQLGNKFQRAHLENKLANLVTEIAEGYEIADAELKAIVSGELTTVEHKFKTPHDISPYCTCWFGTNHMPHTRDFSDALFRRAIVINFNRIFKEDEQDRHLKEKLELELPGILNKALKGLSQLFQNNAFTEPASCKLAKAEWRKEADQVAQFVEEACELGADHAETSRYLYNEYKIWADDSGIRRTLNHKNFTDRMCRLGVTKKRGTRGIRVLSGIRIHPEWQSSRVEYLSFASIKS